MEAKKQKRYKIAELQAAFFDGSVFFSRSSAFRAGCPGRADVIRAFLETDNLEGQCCYSVIIRAELQNHVDYVSESLIRLGYALNREEWPTWIKTVRIPGKPSAGSLRLLKEALEAMDDMVGALPMFMYESTQTKRLRNYVKCAGNLGEGWHTDKLSKPDCVG